MGKKLSIGFLVIVLLFVGYLGVAFVLHRIDKGSISNQSGDAQTTARGSIDQNLIGNWDTGCLVPDPKSPWAERHTFSIKSDGTANHKRYSGNSCLKMAADQDDNGNFTVPSTGKINLSYTTGFAAGVTVYDIYQISGTTLKFGHGFCNCTGNGKNGGSETDRFTAPNNFLLYKKQ